MDFRPCPRCTKLVPGVSVFCRRCGAALPAGEPPAMAPPELKAPASVLPALGAVGLGAVLSVVAMSIPCALTGTCVGYRSQPPLPVEGFIADEGREEPLAAFDGPPVAALRDGYLSVPTVPPRVESLRDVIARNPARTRGPELTDLSARHAGAGYKVAIRGRNLRRATQVLFIGDETGPAAARFVVWDDTRLLAAVPDMGARTQAAAIAVRTEDGVAFTVPRGAPLVTADSPDRQDGPVVVVPRGGASFGGVARVAFVEDGGTVGAHRFSAVFVRRGGRVVEAGPRALVFCEDGAIVPTAGAGVIAVESVNPCFVDSLFHYTGRD